MAVSCSFKECLFDQLGDFNTLKNFSNDFFFLHGQISSLQDEEYTAYNSRCKKIC